LVEWTGGPGENNLPVASHWQTLSHNVVHLALIEIRIIILGDNEVGKSSLISTFCYGLNDISKIKAATHHRKDITIDDIHIQMDIFDTAGNMIISLFLIHKRELN
jgi:GTPase SAR1 family protein